MEGKAIVDAHQLIDQFMNTLIAKNPGETEFHQAVREVSETIIPFIKPIVHAVVNRIRSILILKSQKFLVF